MLLIYRSLWYLLLPLGALWHLVFIWRRAEFRQGFWQRYGWVPKHKQRPLVIHAASVGEVNAMADLIQRLLTQTSLPILITTTTPTGRDRVRQILGTQTDQLQHCYLPFDMGIAVRLFLGRVKPRGILLVETELWPNLLRLSVRHDVPVWLINGRLSQRSAQRYKRFSALSKPMLARLQKLLVQDKEAARRFAHIGVNASNIQVMGSVKFDVALPDNFSNNMAQQWLHTDDVCWVAGSTRGGEETMLLNAWQSMQGINQGLLVIVPRHPRRFAVVADLCEQMGLPWTTYSQGDAHTFAQQTGKRVLLVDSMGLLMSFYSIAHVAFVGGSLVQKGGHNPLEPALLGKPVCMGPYNFNFAYICELLQRAGNLCVLSAADMVQKVPAILLDKTVQQSMGDAGKQLIAEQSGATDAYMLLIRQHFIDDFAATKTNHV